MAKDKEESLNIIPKNEYKEDLEALVKYHTTRVEAGKPFRVHKKYSHIEIPDFGDDKRAKLDWEMEEIRRCKEGYDGMPGRYYFYFNHCRIKHKKRGSIRPDFRATQMHFAAVKDRVLKTPGRGLVTIKRRQIGASWDFAGDNIYDCTFNRDFDIGFNSKSDIDSKSLFVKHKYIHRHTSPFLRAFVHTDRRDAMVFSKWIEKEKKWKGNGSSIICVAPTPTGHAGSAYAKLVIDEAGEQPDLMALWSNAEECLMDSDGVRVGSPFIFGTMGETTKAGKGLMEFWTKADIFNLEKFGLFGYNCAIMDSLGNDNIEDSVRWIIYERKRRESLSPTVMYKFWQKWPLTEEDAFLIVSKSGVGNPITRANVYTRIQDNPPAAVRGYMRPTAGKPDFVPDPTGDILIYERPHEGVRHAYVSATDPAEDDTEKTRDNSNFSTAIMSRPIGTIGPRIVAEYAARPNPMSKAYEQVALMLKWYNNTPTLIELNKGGWRMKDYFEQHYPQLISLAPRAPAGIGGGFKREVGVRMSPHIKQVQMPGLLDGYWDHYSDLIQSLRFVEESGKFGSDHADDDFVTAVGWCLLLLQADLRVATTMDHAASIDPKAHYKNINGRIQLVNNNTPLGRPAVKSTNPLFNR